MYLWWLRTDTVFQRKLRNKKSVNQLEVKDTKTASKYVLTHQEQQIDGNIETKLFKVSFLVTKWRVLFNGYTRLGTGTI